MTRQSKFLAELLRNEQGLSMVEFGLALPVMVLMLMGFMDATMAFSRKMEMQQTAQTGADIIIANFFEQPTDTKLKAELADISGLPQDAFTISRWTACDNIPQQAVTECPSAQMERTDYMKLTVTDTYQPVLGTIGQQWLGPKLLSGEVTVRTN